MLCAFVLQQLVNHPINSDKYGPNKFKPLVKKSYYITRSRKNFDYVRNSSVTTNFSRLKFKFFIATKKSNKLSDLARGMNVLNVKFNIIYHNILKLYYAPFSLNPIT